MPCLHFSFRCLSCRIKIKPWEVLDSAHYNFFFFFTLCVSSSVLETLSLSPVSIPAMFVVEVSQFLPLVDLPGRLTGLTRW